MKKLLKIFSLGLVFSLLFAGFSSANDCVMRNLGNNSICVAIDKGSNNRYTLDSDITCRDGSCAVSCSILLPDDYLEPVGRCDGTFRYNGNSSERVKLYITINNDFSTIEGYYNFRNGTWGDIDDEGGSSSHYNDDLRLSTSNSYPNVGSFVNLTINTDDDYVGDINFYKIQYRVSTSNQWTNISRTSSSYFSHYSDVWGNGYYRMKSSDDGHKVISNFVKFARKGYYRIYAKDSRGNEDYVDFNVGNGSSTDYDLELSTNNRYPSISEYVDLTIETDDDYVGKVYLSAKYRSSTSSSRSNISNTSSTYFSNSSSAWSNGYVSLTASNDGYKKISNAFKFAKKGYYRITIEDENGNEDYVDFNVGDSSSSDFDLELSTNNRYPSISEYVDLTIETDDDYVGKVYLSAKYRSSTSSSRSNISNTSSTYFSNSSSAWANGYVSLTSSNDGYKKISNAFKFAKKGYYRITIEDEYGNEDYVDFNVGNGSSTDYDLELSTNNRYPSTSEYVDLTIETDDDYVGKVYLSAKYRSSTSSSRSNISNTSSTYFSNSSSAWSNGYVSLTSSNDGYKKISNAFKFAKKGYYRITIEDEYGNEDYIDFNVGNGSSTDYDLELSTNNRYPSTSEYVDLTIETDDDYVGKVYLSAKYRSSTSSSRSNISNTSSTYFSNSSSAWANGYVSLTASNDGYKKISNAFKFAKKGHYRITIEDENGNEDYVDFNVGNGSSSDRLDLETNDDTPNANEYVDLTVNTDRSYRGKVNFSAKYRSSTSNSRSNVSITSSTYFINRSTTWNNGYINMTSADYGEKTIRNIFKFAKKGYYRIIATDEDGNSTYLDFGVGNSGLSPLDGFTVKEFEMIERIYNVWPTLIRKLKNEYPRLKNNTTWNTLSDELYKNMGDVVNKKSNREFRDYDDFDTAFRYRFSRTQNLMH